MTHLCYNGSKEEMLPHCVNSRERDIERSQLPMLSHHTTPASSFQPSVQDELVRRSQKLERQRAYYAMNRDALREKHKQYYEEHKEEIRSKHREYERAHRDETKNRRAAYRAANPELIRAQNKDRKDKQKKPCLECGKLTTAKELCRSCQKKGERNPQWRGNHVGVTQGRYRARRKFQGLRKQPCADCGKLSTELHHIDGNTLNNEADNVVPLCRRCHMLRDERLTKLVERLKAGPKVKAMHCKRGHVFDQVNTYVKRDGRRSCRTCHREQELRRYRARKTLMLTAASEAGGTADGARRREAARGRGEDRG